MPLSKRSKLSVLFSMFALIAIISGLLITGVVQRSQNAHAAGSQFVRQISSAGTTSFTSTAPGKDGFQSPEVNSVVAGLGHAPVHQSNGANRSGSQHPSNVSPTAQGTTATGSGTELKTSFDGINHRQQRLANGGNQFSLEPPDQGLCAGNGFILESVNDALNVYDANGKSLLGVTALNTFYGYPPEINRSTGVFGPLPTDPSCYFDQPTQRWFHIVLTLGQDPKTGNFTGQNQLDLAVSNTSSPLGAFTLYHINTVDDGTGGTPNHMCQGQPPTGLGPCIGDYPHIGADANGFYITTNEYGFFAPGLGFHAAQIYALSKQALAANAASVTVVQIDTIGLVGSP